MGPSRHGRRGSWCRPSNPVPSQSSTHHVRSLPAALYRTARLLFAVLFLQVAGSLLHTASAQTAVLRGFVTSESDGQPLPGVNVLLESDDGLQNGAATNSDGFYAFSRLDPGTYYLRASFIGFETYFDTLQVEAGITLHNIALSEDLSELDEVLVETERETAGAAGITAGLQTVRPRDIEVVPMPDLSADIANYLTALPGVVSQGDRGGQLFIRGGEPTQNMVLLDGIPIYQPFHFIGFFSAFPSEIINTADVYAGGFGSRFGGALSSVIDIATRTGNKNRFSGAASVAPFVAAARIEGPLVPGHVSVLGSVRESLIEQGASRIVDARLPFSFADRFGKIHANLGSGTQLSITGLHTEDSGRLGVDPLNTEQDDVPEDEVLMENLALGARFIFLPPDINMFAEVLISRSQVESSIGPAGDALRSSKTTRTGANAHVTHYLGNLNVNWGLSVHTVELNTDLEGFFQNIEEKTEYVTETSIYFEPSYEARNGLRIEPGLRLQSFPSKGRTYLEPRLRVVWNLGIHRFSTAAGIYHQEIAGLNDRRDVGNVFTAWTSSPSGIVPEARHLIVGWRSSPFSWLDVSLEGFYKKLDDLVVPEWTAYPRFTTRLHPARGDVAGLDARVEITAGPVYSAVSYGVSKVEYLTRVPALEFAFGESETRYSPPHDRQHQLSFIGGFSFRDFELNVRWQFGSGLPFSESMGFDRFIMLDSLVNVTTEPGSERVLYSRPYTGRLPTYHRLDVTMEYGIDLTRAVRLTAQAGAINAYDRLNFFYLDLFTLRRVDQLPLIPTFGLKLQYN